MEVTYALTDMTECDVIPAINQEVLVLVTETIDKDAEEALARRIQMIPNLQSMTLVSGFNEIAIDVT